MQRTQPRTDPKAVAAALATLVVWSSAFSAVSIVVGPGGGYGPGEMALLRFLVASATMGVIALATRMRLPALKDLPNIAAAAIFGITIYHLCFTWGETTVSPGAAALVIASGPIWTALLAIVFLGERGQAKTRMIRSLVNLLDEEIPTLSGCEISDHPYQPICRRCIEKIQALDTRIEPGAINWMTAGRGIVHSERTPPEQRAIGSELAGLQCWVALPRESAQPEKKTGQSSLIHSGLLLVVLRRGIGNRG